MPPNNKSNLHIFLSISYWGKTRDGKTPLYITSTGPNVSGPHEFDTVESLTADEIGQMMGGN